jgi:hypothetical protein
LLLGKITFLPLRLTTAITYKICTKMVAHLLFIYDGLERFLIRCFLSLSHPEVLSWNISKLLQSQLPFRV